MVKPVVCTNCLGLREFSRRGLRRESKHLRNDTVLREDIPFESKGYNARPGAWSRPLPMADNMHGRRQVPMTCPTLRSSVSPAAFLQRGSDNETQ
jgi:hypothetical protein